MENTELVQSVRYALRLLCIGKTDASRRELERLLWQLNARPARGAGFPSGAPAVRPARRTPRRRSPPGDDPPPAA